MQRRHAYELENSQGVNVEVIAQGATMFDLSLLDETGSATRTNFLRDNIERSTYFGENTDNFSRKRGMIVNGGVRFTAVAPIHGLCYDTDWDVSVNIA
jgi:hypothetical protein